MRREECSLPLTCTWLSVLEDSVRSLRSIHSQSNGTRSSRDQHGSLQYFGYEDTDMMMLLTRDPIRDFRGKLLTNQVSDSTKLMYTKRGRVS